MDDFGQPDFERDPTVEPAPPRGIPCSVEAEAVVLGCCLHDREALEKCVEANVEEEWFFKPAHQIIFRVMMAIHTGGRHVDEVMVADQLQSLGLLEEVGGYPCVTSLGTGVEVTGLAGDYIEIIRDKAVLRKIIRLGTESVEAAFKAKDPYEALEGMSVKIEGLKNAGSFGLPEGKSLMEFGYPDKDDANRLLGSDDYLNRGGGMIIISYAGIGKSSLAIQAASCWGMGKPFMGIGSAGPLRSLVVQAEDDDRYIGKIAESIRQGMGLTPEEAAMVQHNVIVVRDKVHVGDQFFGALARYVHRFSPDLVFINPAYLYAKGDIIRPEVATEFLSGLDRVNRDEKFGYVIIHHTGKPQSPDQKTEREDWETIYLGFGSSYIANWPRASILVEPRGERGQFWLRLGKGGMNAGVCDKVEQGAGHRYEPVTRVAVQHSQRKIQVGESEKPMILWEPSDYVPPASNNPKGRGPIYEADDFLPAFNRGEENATSFTQALRVAQEINTISKTSFSRVRSQLAEEGKIVLHSDGIKFYRPTT